MKVVIADDSSTIRIKMARFIKDLGHSVVGEAENGYEAIKLTNETEPDLVTLDLVMPELDGLSALKAIRSQNKTVLIVMVSSAATLANEAAAQKAGANGFLKKPFDKDSLRRILEQITHSVHRGDAA
ncbi:MAG: response regulator [Deltaproteobacteria bacterium]|nr:response regulator [Deltaproteobacteria bacterium]